MFINLDFDTSLFQIRCKHLGDIQGGHKPGKDGKPGKLRKFEKLSKSRENSGKFEFLWKNTWKTQGK